MAIGLMRSAPVRISTTTNDSIRRWRATVVRRDSTSSLPTLGRGVLFLLPSPLSWGEGWGVRGGLPFRAKRKQDPLTPNPESPQSRGRGEQDRRRSTAHAHLVDRSDGFRGQLAVRGPPCAVRPSTGRSIA